MNNLLAALLPICVVIGCAFRTSPLNRDLLACFTCYTLTATPFPRPTPRNHADPMAIIPVYSSVFTDSWRLAFCLLGHPVILEICLFSLRGYERSNQPFMTKAWNTGGKEAFSASAGCMAFMIEAILVLDRRFLIGYV